MKFYIILFLSLLTLCFSSVQADEDPIKISLVSENTAIAPGHSFTVALRFIIDEDWHAYWKNPGATGMPSTIEWTLPEGFVLGATEWPTPQKFDLSDMISFGYEGEVWALTTITAPAPLKAAPFEIKAKVEWLVCSHADCLPGETTSTLTLPVEEKSLVDSSLQHSFAEAKSKLPKKNWEIKAERKDELIALKLKNPAPDGVKYTRAEFFPEENNHIDLKNDVTLAFENGSYLLVLKEQEASSSLKGIVLLQTGSETEAIEVNTPIQEEETIAYEPHVVTSPSETKEEGGFVIALFFAFIGGAILNLMPCVLPVISFKILSFVKMANECRKVTLKHGIAFTVGILFSFWVLAGLLLTLQAYGNSVGWGFQLQEPIFVALLSAFLFIFALSLFGVFELGTSLTTLAGKANMVNSGLSGSFFSGILATAVATPCTGPFLGTAIGFAVTLPALPALMIFTSLGVGMASPYLLLASFPRLLRFIPKPGNWMITFKEITGFIMLATVLWLTWVFSSQTSSLSLSFLLSSFFLLGLGCWVLGKWGTPLQSKATRMVGYGVVALCFLAGTYLIYFSSTPSLAMQEVSHTPNHAGWEPYSEERVAELQKKGIPVFVDFTAKWCLICQANHLVLNQSKVQDKFESLGVVKMQADWTKRDATIAEALKKFGRNAVPLYLLYSGDEKEHPKILPQILTPDIVLNHLNNVEGLIAERE